MRLFSILLVFCIVFSVASPLLASSKSPTDDELTDRIRIKLANDPDVKGGTFDVIVKDGLVTIRGKVEHEKWRQKAEKLVKKVHGVKGVVNELRIAPMR